jgi:iron complex outermembrane receptor protein
MPSQAQETKDKDLVAPEVVVTATRFEEAAGREAIGVTIITADDIKQSGATSLPQLLSRHSGIGTRDSSGSPDVQIDLRGFGVTGDQNTVVLLDGIRMNENELTTVKWSSIALESIDRVEILRGSGAVLYGNGATGGVINIITKNPKAGDKNGGIQLRGGSYGAVGGAASASVAGEKLGLRVGTRYDETDNYREHNALRQRNVDLTLRTLGEGPSLTFAGGAEVQDLELPGALNKAQIQANRRAVNPFSVADYADRKSEYARITGVVPIGRGEFAMDFGYRHKDVDAVLFSPVQTDTRTWSASPRLRLPYDAMGAAHTLVVGLDLEDWDYDSQRPDPFAPVNLVADQSNQAFYLQHTTDFPTDTRVSLGGRAQNSTSHARDINNPAPYASDKQDEDLNAYELAVRQQFNTGFSAYAKVGYSFRVATLDESFAQFGGPFFDSTVNFLDPQTSHDREIGVQYSSAGLQGRLAFFQIDSKNEIHFNPVTFLNVNLPPTRRQGLEVDLSKAVTDSVELMVSYTYTAAEFREGIFGGVDVTGKKVPLVPRHRAGIGLNARLGEHTRLNVAATYTGEQYFDNDESNTFGEKMPAYTVVDLRLSHSIDRWTFSLAVNNLFDEEYFSYAVRSLATPNYNAYPQPERNFYAAVEYRFGK